MTTLAPVVAWTDALCYCAGTEVFTNGCCLGCWLGAGLGSIAITAFAFWVANACDECDRKSQQRRSNPEQFHHPPQSNVVPVAVVMDEITPK